MQLHGDVLALNIQLQAGFVILNQRVPNADLLALLHIDFRDSLLRRGINLLQGVAAGCSRGGHLISPIGGAHIHHGQHVDRFLVRLVLYEKPKPQDNAHRQHKGNAGDDETFFGFFVYAHGSLVPFRAAGARAAAQNSVRGIKGCSAVSLRSRFGRGNSAPRSVGIGAPKPPSRGCLEAAGRWDVCRCFAGAAAGTA